MRYGYWRTDKPKEAGFSHEFISSDTARLMKKTGATLDTLYGCEIEGVDTLYKALQRNVKLIPNHRWFGTRNGNRYEWLSIKQVADIAEHLSYGIVKLGLVPEILAEGEYWKFLGI